ncbi:MAG: hypothetical protein AB8E82_08130 [Aureispira sp.]
MPKTLPAFIFALLFFVFFACDNTSSHDHHHHGSKEEVHRTAYKSPDGKIQWSVDSIYDPTGDHLISYHYRSQVSTQETIINHNYKRTWSGNRSLFPDYPQQYNATWTLDSLVSYTNDATPLRQSKMIHITLLSPKELSYERSTSVLQSVFDKVQAYAVITTPKLPDYPIVSNLLMRFHLSPYPSGRTIKYTNPHFKTQDAVWLEEEQLLLPLDIDMAIAPFSHKASILYTDSLPNITTDSLQ